MTETLLWAASLLELSVICLLLLMLRAARQRPTTLINARLVERKLQPDLSRRQRRALARQK